MMDSTKTIKEIAAHEEQLPWELVEEILSRVPPISLVRFRIVCKRWNAILDDKTFINNHKETFRFILTTRSKIYSVSVDPKIVVRDLTLDIPGLGPQIPTELVDCDEFLICRMRKKRAAVCNPWLKRSTLIKTHRSFDFEGIVYNDSNRRSEERVYKTIWSSGELMKIHDFASGTWKDAMSKSGGGNQVEKKPPTLHSATGVPVNGTLFWISFFYETDPLYCLLKLDLSKGRLYIFCDLPCAMSNPLDALVLRVFKGDRFSVLKQCHVTKKIEIWVTKNKVDVKDRNGVVWMSFMTLSIPNFPSLVPTGSNSQPSYFMDDKRLVVCSCDETGQAWIYVFGENKLMSKVKLDYVVDPWPLHCTYFPNLVPVPRRQRDEAELQV